MVYLGQPPWKGIFTSATHFPPSEGGTYGLPVALKASGDTCTLTFQDGSAPTQIIFHLGAMTAPVYPTSPPYPPPNARIGFDGTIVLTP